MKKTAQDPAELVAVENNTLSCEGRWTVGSLGPLADKLNRYAWPEARRLLIRGDRLTAMDTTGAWLLHRTVSALGRQGRQVETREFPERYRELLERVEALAEPGLPSPPPRSGGLERIGRLSINTLRELLEFISFTGEAFACLFRTLAFPRQLRWRAVLEDMDTAGVRALGIVGLLSFLMGVVITYQGAVQLRIYGANIYVADLVGLSMLRELSPLLAAIIVAGRTGSAYTAQIGTMQVTEEISALRTIGISPHDLLVLPKIISLCISLPLLAIFADITGIIGGMVMAKLTLGLGFEPFLARLNDAVSFRSFFLGVSKAPVFAMIVALVGCYQGFRVHGSAASVGHHTTLSVVQSIFLVIVADALFSILFSWLEI
jgi:phospholipid/cholesterol/gamma-HCH transport system permease protein